MTNSFDSRFHSALTDLAEDRAVETDEARATAVITLADLVLESARMGDRRLPDHFDELMQALLPRVGARVRSELSRRLAHCDLLPSGTVQLLAADDLEVSGPILRQSPVLGEADMIAVATGESDEKARAIAGRADLTSELVSALIDRQDPVIGASLALAPVRAIDEKLAERIAHIPDLPRVAAQRLIELADLSDEILAQLFWLLEHEPRRRILDRLARRHREREQAVTETPDHQDSPAEDQAAPNKIAADRIAHDSGQLGEALFALAAAGDLREIAARLAEVLGVSRSVGVRIVEDFHGEALTVATRAADLSVERITSIVLLAVPEAGNSYERLRTLAGMAENLTPSVARHIVGLWGLDQRIGRATIRHEAAVAAPAPRPRGATQSPRRYDDVVIDIRRQSGS